MALEVGDKYMVVTTRQAFFKNDKGKWIATQKIDKEIEIKVKQPPRDQAPPIEQASELDI